jgi:diguanylate cyclase (GGDEF)-like protein
VPVGTGGDDRAGPVATAAGPEPGGGSPGAFRERVLRVSVLARLLVVATTAVALLSQGSVDWKVNALIALATANVAYLITRVPWEDLLHRPSGMRWLYTWSVLDIALVTLGIANTGGARSELFGLYVLAVVLYATTYPPSGQVVLLGLMVAGYLTVVAFETVSPGFNHMVVRLGGLGLVAYVASFLSRELLGQTRAHDEARAESESRAALLAGVAAAARTMSTLDPGRVLETVVDAALDLGFDGAQLCLFDEEGGTWRLAHHRGVEVEPAPVRPLDAGAAGLVRARRATVVLDDHSGWPLGVRPALEAGYRYLVACPVWSGGELAGALVAGSLTRAAPYPHEVECLDLLAAHAGAAFENARLYAERREFEAKLAHQAFHDSLTGLPNRALFLDRLEQALARGRRDGEPVGVLFLDLDGFKAVNDHLGHERGDELLVAVSQRLQACLRPGDTLARFGGDEFTVLLEKLRSDADGIDVAERLLNALADPFILGGHRVAISASIGASFAKAPFREGLDPLREADQAMYRAKERGEGRWEVFRAEMNAVAVYRLELEAELRGALDASTWRRAASRAWRPWPAGATPAAAPSSRRSSSRSPPGPGCPSSSARGCWRGRAGRPSSGTAWACPPSTSRSTWPPTSWWPPTSPSSWRASSSAPAWGRAGSRWRRARRSCSPAARRWSRPLVRSRPPAPTWRWTTSAVGAPPCAT